MKHSWRTMKRGDHYEIEECIGDGIWAPICSCGSISEAKELLENLHTLEEEGKNEPTIS